MNTETRIEIDAGTGEIVSIPVDEEWIITNRPDQVSLELATPTVFIQLLNALGQVKAARIPVTVMARFTYDDQTSEVESYAITLDNNGRETINIPTLESNVTKLEVWIEEPDSNVIEVLNGS